MLRNHYGEKILQVAGCIRRNTAYIDLTFSIDIILHNGLLLKLWTAGIQGSLFNLLRNFLKCRLIRTKLDGVLSSPIKPKRSSARKRTLTIAFHIFHRRNVEEY